MIRRLRAAFDLLEPRSHLSSAQLADLNLTPAAGSGWNDPSLASDGYVYGRVSSQNSSTSIYRIDGTPGGTQPIATIGDPGRSRQFERLPAGLVFNHGSQVNNGHAEASDLYVVPTGSSIAQRMTYTDFALRPRQLTPMIRAGGYVYYWTRTGLARTDGTWQGTTMISATLAPPADLTWQGSWQTMNTLIASSGMGAVVTNRTSLWRVSVGGALTTLSTPPGFGSISGVYSGMGFAFVVSTTGKTAAIRDSDGAIEELPYGGPVLRLGAKYLIQRFTGLAITDGTAAGTELLLDAEGQSTGGASYVASDGAVAVFSVTGSFSRNGLWKTDGTAAGTSRFSSAISLAGGSNGLAGFTEIVPWVRLIAIEGADIVCLGTVNGATGFYRVNATSPESPVLLRAAPDATTSARAVGVLDAPGFALIQPPAPVVGDLLLVDPTITDGVRPAGGPLNYLTAASSPAYFHSLTPGDAIFWATGTSANAWYRTDGTADGTVPVTGDGNVGSIGAPVTSVAAGDAVLFIGRTSLQGDGLFRVGYDGSVVRLHELFLPEASIGDSTRLIPVSGGRWAYAAGDSLWLTDGTLAGTRRASGLLEVCWYVRSLAELNGRFYFNAYRASTGTEMYSSNGTSTDLQVVDLVAGSASSSPGIFGTAGGKVILAQFQSGTGMLLKASNGTLAGTAAIGPVFNSVQAVAQAGAFVYFLGRTASSGDFTLWQTDGTSAGTRSLGLASNTVSPMQAVVVGDELFGVAQSRAFRMRNSGTTSPELLSPAGQSVASAFARGPDVYFTVSTPVANSGVYRVDSTATTLSFDLHSASSAVYPLATPGAALGDGSIVLSGSTGEPAIFRANDGAAPRVLGIAYDHATSQVRVRFDKPIIGLTADDLQIVPSVGTPQSATSVRYNGLTDQAIFSLPRIMPSSMYAITLPADAVTDAAARSLQSAATTSVAFQQGDITGDGTANFDDLLVLASNYNQSIRAYAQGDLTSDERVNFDDLLVLAANYNRSPSGAIALISGPGMPPREGESEGDDYIAAVLLA
jgi:ELWxxDGT repeat protein